MLAAISPVLLLIPAFRTSPISGVISHLTHRVRWSAEEALGQDASSSFDLQARFFSVTCLFRAILVMIKRPTMRRKDDDLMNEIRKAMTILDGVHWLSKLGVDHDGTPIFSPYTLSL